MTRVPYKIVWIAGMARSGSMWTFNVARSLLREAGFAVFPPTALKRDDEAQEEARKGLQDSCADNIWCLKIHGVRKGSPMERFISPYRDPRDAVISYMRFVRCSFDNALAATAYWTRFCDHYRAMPPELSLCLDYKEIAEQPLGAAGRISTFLGLNSSAEVIANVVAHFDRENVRQRIEVVEERARHRRAAGDPDAAGAFVRNWDGTERVMDEETGFQSGHVSGCQPGDWRRLLTGEQQWRLDQAIGAWLEARGYER
jgi:hypothetical protein